jgi:hypothetical protein
MHLIPPILLALNAVPAPTMRLADRRIGSISDIRPGRRQWTSAHIELELPPVHLREEAYSPLGRIMFQRVRIAGPVLPGNRGRSTPKTCPPSCIPPTAAHPALIMGSACNFTASLTFASGAGLAASSAAGHPIHRLHQHLLGWYSSAPGSSLGSGGGGRHGSLPTSSHPRPSS